MSKTQPTPTPEAQTIEGLIQHQLKVTYRYKMAIVAISMLILGLIGGYFLSIEVITKGQERAISVLTTPSK